MNHSIGIYIIGDEILSGKRQDAHLNFVIQALKSRGLQLAWANYLGDIPAQITSSLKASMERNQQNSQQNNDIVFSFGGIGATPDDFTRQCAAEAAGVPLARHAGAVAEIEAQYGESAYPKRVLMADFPLGASLIPNPVNRVAGFAINGHYFVPGFPQMAHPMITWVLDTYYKHLFHQQDYIEASILVMDAGESNLIDLMRQILAQYPALKLFSLPKLDSRRTTELGVKGEAAHVEAAINVIKQSVTALGFPWTGI
ncbi:MAG: molybdopterin-binding protein [Methylotenera sp.]|uniref:competence/damage-inducible protein A n=1 Tax=Methylotenera sp. TaxID=2051956 RepID=UPI00272005A4|nr:molybdopterin-binding protein [Methylotenera sp.]MDO9392428.1 molybdopterin-binding protein [Methylotenera sp.]MDP1523154.1 molybdopterin-binding protein [Methylotenera sp.]MDZ4210420.1 molybdopterin-binding protein [Methylotenera sp.]